MPRLWQTRMASTICYAAARAAYDEAYLANKTASLRADVAAQIGALTRDLVALSNASFPDVFAGVDLAAACLSGRSDANFSTPCFGGSLEDARELFEAYVARADYQVQLASNTVDAYAERAEDYVDRVGDAYASARDFYEGVTGWIGDAGVATPSGGWFDLGLSDFYAAPPAWPDDFYVFPAPGKNYLYPPSLDAVYDALLLNLTRLSRETHARAVAVARELEQIPASIDYGDYAPPAYAAFAPDDDDSLANASSRFDGAADDFVNGSAPPTRSSRSPSRSTCPGSSSSRSSPTTSSTTPTSRKGGVCVWRDA